MMVISGMLANAHSSFKFDLDSTDGQKATNQEAKSVVCSLQSLQMIVLHKSCLGPKLVMLFIIENVWLQ